MSDAPLPPLPVSVAPAHILYIDDDEGLRRLTRRALERRGHRVATAASGAEGVAMATAQAFDLVAVDHYMPGQDGLATLAELQALDRPPPVIYVTASDESRLAVASLKAGAIDYVLKTPDADYFDLLGQAIEQALASVRLRQAHAQAQEALQQSNARLQSLLHEVNHRVANSLQLVSSLVGMQARLVGDPAARAALDDTGRRIVAIAKVHRRLYTATSVESVEMGAYLTAMAEEIAETWSTPAAPRHISCIADPLEFPTDEAVMLGVIVNELVTNACKYAYAADAPGEVRLRLSAGEQGAFALVVEDDGRGLPAHGKPEGTGLGSKLIEAMAGTLRAQIRYEPQAQGLRAVLERS
jgi:two-component sensor histidine kinase